MAAASLQSLGTNTSITGAGAVTVTINGVNATNGYTNLVDPVDSDGGINNSTTASTKALGLTTDGASQA